jgi:hypothetical protein
MTCCTQEKEEDANRRREQVRLAALARFGPKPTG